jgi:hypothetical protein
MTEPLVLLVAFLTICCALAAAWAVVPTPVALEAEPWFKAVLGRRLARRHGVDAVRRWVPFHAHLRPLDVWLERPGVHVADGAADASQAVLRDRLAGMPDAAARWAWWAAQPGVSALVDDLPALGRTYAPEAQLGPDWGWMQLDEDDGLARMAAEAETRLDATWVWVAGTPHPEVPDVASVFATHGVVVPWWHGLEEAGLSSGLLAWRDALRSLATAPMPWWMWRVIDDEARWLSEMLLAASVVGVGDALRAEVPEERPSRRLLVGGSGVGVSLVLRALAADMDLRDRVVGVASAGGLVMGWPGLPGALGERACRDWMEANFRHERLDVEVIRLVPYASVQFAQDTPLRLEAGGIPVDAARFPRAGFVGAGAWQAQEPEAIEVADLGVLMSDGIDVTEVATTLRYIVASWALARS